MSDAAGRRATPAMQAEADVACFRADPAMLPRLPLGRFSDAGVRSLLVRRALLKLPLPSGALEAWATTAKIPSRGRALAGELAYWRQVKRLMSRAEWMKLTHAPVILMYHAIGAAGEPASRYILPETRFGRQTAWLRARGYRLATVRDLARTRAEGGLPEPKTVVVTLDDGYRDNGAALRRAGVPATIFVVTAARGGRNSWDRGGDLAGRELLDWDEARALVRLGVEIGGHTRTHPALTEAEPGQLADEVRGSLEDLQRELGPGPYTFAYPHGRFDDRVQDAVKAAGYAAACCSRGGANDPCVADVALRRVEIKGTDSFVSFVLMVWLGRRITPLQFLRSLLLG